MAAPGPPAAAPATAAVENLGSVRRSGAGLLGISGEAAAPLDAAAASSTAARAAVRMRMG
jgi:hypothetical protein